MAASSCVSSSYAQPLEHVAGDARRQRDMPHAVLGKAQHAQIDVGLLDQRRHLSIVAQPFERHDIGGWIGLAQPVRGAPDVPPPAPPLARSHCCSVARP